MALADVADPMALFRRHADAAPEFALVSSLLPDPDIGYDVLDAAFLLRWEELTARGGPEELPPLQPRHAAREWGR